MKRSQYLAVLAACSALTVSTPNAGATVTASVVPVPIFPDALTDDPNLANYKTFDLMVTVSGGEHWLSCDMLFHLTAGTFYVPPQVDQNIVSQLRNTPGYRFLQNDTFVTVPVFNMGRTNLLGGSTFNHQQGAIFPSNGSNFLDPSDPNQTAFLAANDMMLVDAAWAFTPNGPIPSDGTYTLARLTMTSNAFGQLIGRYGVQEHIPTPVSFTFSVPEPTSVTLVCAGLASLAARGRSRG